MFNSPIYTTALAVLFVCWTMAPSSHLVAAATPSPTMRDCVFSEQATCALKKFDLTVLQCLSGDASCNLTMYCDMAAWSFVRTCFEAVPCYGLQFNGRTCFDLFTACPNGAAMTATLCAGAYTPAPPPSRAAVDPRAILTELYQSTQGYQWNRRLNWNTTADICTWTGVTCRGTNVVKLSLSANMLRGTIPDSLGTLWTLEELDLSENQLTGPIYMLGNLTELTKLSLGERILTSVCVFPYQGPGMEDCQGWPDGGQMEGSYQEYAINMFTGDAENIYNLTKLTHLTLRGAELRWTLDKRICQLKNLEYMYIRYSPFFTGSVPDCLPPTLTKLRVFLFSGCSLTGTLPATIASMPSLVQFGLAGNYLTGTLPGFAPNLMHYFLNSNKFIGDLPPAQPYFSPDGVIISNLMESILAYSNNLTGTLPASYSQMKNLKYVWVSDNKLQGTIPPSWGDLTLLMVALDRNQLSGTLPSFFINWNRDYTFANVPAPYCQTCAFGNLIPTSVFPIRFSTAILRLGRNNFSGTIDPRILDLPLLYDLELSYNSLSGNIESLLSGRSPMKNLKYDHNKLTGSFHNSGICGQNRLEIVELGGNAISGTIPSCIGNLKNVVRFNMQQNRLSGTLPAAMSNMTALRILDLSQNSIGGQVPLTFSSMITLRSINLGYNQISGELFINLKPLSTLPALTSINFEHNQLSRDVNFFIFVAIGSDTNWESCKSWNLAYNNLVGTLPPIFDQYALEMTYLNLEGNDLEGEVPAMPNMDVVLLKNNPRLRASSITNRLILMGNNTANGTLNSSAVAYNYGNLPPLDNRTLLPSFMKTTNFFLRTDPTYSCPILTGAEKEIVASLDASYYNYTFCQCNPGFFGTPPVCKPCLPRGVCDGVSGLMRIPSGLFPTPTLQSPQFLITCPETIVRSETSNCNPDNADEFKCKKGTFGRVCSQCAEGFYKKQARCVECPSLGASIAIVVCFFLGLLILGGVLALLPKPVRQSAVLVLKTLILYMQFGNVLITKTGLQWPDSLIALNFAFDLTSVNLAFFQCLVGSDLLDISMETQALSFIVFILLAIAIFFFLFVFFELLNWIQQNAEDNLAVDEDDEWVPPESNEIDENDAKEFFIRDRSIFETQDDKVKPIKRKFFFVRGTITVLKFLYLPISTGILQVFQCENDPGLNKSFMRFNPARECSHDDPIYQRNFILACILIPIFVIGFPLFVVYISIRYQQRHKVARNVWFFLFNDYKEGNAMFLLWSLMRSLTLSVICVLIPRSANITLNLLVIFLLIVIFVNLYVVPYVHSVQNYQEDLALIALGVTLGLGLVNSSVTSTQEQLMAATILMVQILFVLGLIYSILLHGEVIPVSVVRFFPFWRFITDKSESTGVGVISTYAVPMSASMYAATTPTNMAASMEADALEAAEQDPDQKQPRMRGAAYRAYTLWIQEGQRILNRTKRSGLCRENVDLLESTNQSLKAIDDMNKTMRRILKERQRNRSPRSPGQASLSDEFSGSFTKSPLAKDLNSPKNQNGDQGEGGVGESSFVAQSDSDYLTESAMGASTAQHHSHNGNGESNGVHHTNSGTANDQHTDGASPFFVPITDEDSSSSTAANPRKQSSGDSQGKYYPMTSNVNGGGVQAQEGGTNGSTKKDDPRDESDDVPTTIA